MVIALLAVIVILLVPGGAPFLGRLCSAIVLLLSLGCAYALWGAPALWVVAGFAVIIAGAFVYAAVAELRRPRKRLLSGGSRPPT